MWSPQRSPSPVSPSPVSRSPSPVVRGLQPPRHGPPAVMDLAWISLFWSEEGGRLPEIYAAGLWWAGLCEEPSLQLLAFGARARDLVSPLALGVVFRCAGALVVPMLAASFAARQRATRSRHRLTDARSPSSLELLQRAAARLPAAAAGDAERVASRELRLSETVCPASVARATDWLPHLPLELFTVARRIGELPWVSEAADAEDPLRGLFGVATSGVGRNLVLTGPGGIEVAIGRADPRPARAVYDRLNPPLLNRVSRGDASAIFYGAVSDGAEHLHVEIRRSVGAPLSAGLPEGASAAACLFEVCHTLHTAHCRGVLHGDVCAEHVFVARRPAGPCAVFSVGDPDELRTAVFAVPTDWECTLLGFRDPALTGVFYARACDDFAAAAAAFGDQRVASAVAAARKHPHASLPGWRVLTAFEELRMSAHDPRATGVAPYVTSETVYWREEETS